MNKLKNQIISGVFWNAVQLVIQRSFSFVIKLILARLLFPEDFGLVGMAAVFTSFVAVFNDLGMGAALVQRKKENLNEDHYYTAFWTGIVWSTLLYLVIAFGVGPLAALFYGEPLMADIIPVLSLGILASPFNLVHKAQLTKAMNFKKIAFIANASNIFSGLVALGLAFAGAGVWALVFNSVATIVIGIPLYFKATGWKPKTVWKKKEFNEIFGFGMYTTGTGIFNTVISKLDYLVIGKMLTASALGVYTLAFLLTDTFKSQIMGVMNKVMYPVYGKMQDNKSSIKTYYLKVILYNSALIYPVMVFLLVLGRPFINHFFGDKWDGTILPLQILAVAVMFSLMVNSHTSLLRGMGKPDLEMKIQLFRALVLYMPLIIAGTYFYGMIGTALAVLVNKIAAVFIAQHFLKKIVGINLKDLFKALQGPLAGTFVSGFLGYLIYSMLNIHYLMVGLFIGIVYFLILYLLMKKEIMLIYRRMRQHPSVEKSLQKKT